MSQTRILQKAALGELLQKLVAGGQRVLAPVTSGERIEFAEVTPSTQLATDYLQTATSAKSAVFPRH